MIIKAEMDSKLFDVNEELKKRNMRIEELERQNKQLKELLKKISLNDIRRRVKKYVNTKKGVKK